MLSISHPQVNSYWHKSQQLSNNSLELKGIITGYKQKESGDGPRKSFCMTHSAKPSCCYRNSANTGCYKKQSDFKSGPSF